MLKRLWNDAEGGVISPEIAVVGAALLVGVLVGLAALRLPILTEIQDVGKAVESIDFTPTVTPVDPPPGGQSPGGGNGGAGNGNGPPFGPDFNPPFGPPFDPPGPPPTTPPGPP